MIQQNKINNFYKAYNLLYNANIKNGFTELESIKTTNSLLLEYLTSSNVDKEKIKEIKEIKNYDYEFIFSEIFEKIINNHEIGAFYTDFNTRNYITSITIYSYILNQLNEPKVDIYIKENKDLLQLILKHKTTRIATILNTLKILEPSCGSGAFVFQCYDVLKNLYRKINVNISKIDIFKKHIFGYDIDDIAMELLTFRIKIFLHKNNFDLKDIKNIIVNFKQENFLNVKNNIQYSCVIGNPPYLEKRKVNYLIDQTLKSYKCGNIYAFFLEKSFQVLKKHGTIGVVIPLSFISTKRMNPLREIFTNNSDFIYVSSFGDRPSCLFNGVHQKINILLANKNIDGGICDIYTSSYYHWYKEEYSSLFKRISYIKNSFSTDLYVPKVGNNMEINIIKKMNQKTSNLYDLVNNSNGRYVAYVNMRATFWIKTSSSSSVSKEYKKFEFQTKDESLFFLAILNSSLFFFFWEKISDGWHITLKELKDFKIEFSELKIKQKENFIKLYKKLENDLDKNKKYIGSSQVIHEYRHKLSKVIIDEIDNELAKVYKFTKSELEYIKMYQAKYRMNNAFNSYVESIK